MTEPSGQAEQARLLTRLENREFEFELSILQVVYYWTERKLGHAFLRRRAPAPPSPRMLNLGCGPHIYPGWINADDYAIKRRFREAAFRPDWHLDITRRWNCSDNHWDGIFCEHVVEHVTYSQAVHVLKECYRTLTPGSWVRISVPDLARYLDFYQGRPPAGFWKFPEPALAVSFLAQMHLHRSVWDGALMTRLLKEIGFTNARVVAFSEGSDSRVIRDDPDKVHESLYVEAQKAR